MKTLKLLLIILILPILSNGQQASKPAFKNLICVSYHSDENGKGIVIEDKLEINAKGEVDFKIKLYEGAADTTYKLSQSLLNDFSQYFNKDLSTYMIADRLPDGKYYGGSLKYINYTDGNGLTHEFILLPPLMNQSFNDILDKVSSTPENLTKVKGLSIQDKGLTAKIIHFQKSCKYCSGAQMPPPIMLDSH